MTRELVLLERSKGLAMEKILVTAMTYVAKTRDTFNLGEKYKISNCSEDLDDDERGDVPGWVLVVLMTTGLVTAIWTLAAPRLSTILRNSLDAMNGIR